MYKKTNKAYQENFQITSQVKFCPNAFRVDLYRGCDFGCQYCASGETNIFMHDMSFKKLKDIRIGDELYGVEEHAKFPKLMKSIVTNIWCVEKDAYEITLQNGTKLVCSGDHRWLTNRGWKYTMGSMCGENQRPYLTTNNKMLGFSFIDSHVEETDDFKLGYLSGIIRGDANLAFYTYSSNNKCETAYRFRLAIKGVEATRRASEYLSYFGVDTTWFDFDMIDRSTKEHIKVPSIRTCKKENYLKIKKLIEFKESDEFIRGFVSGVYDAEGSVNPHTIRIYNTDAQIISMIEQGLIKFGFNYTFDADRITVNNKVVKSVRILGTMSERIRFISTFNPKLRPNLDDIVLRNCSIPLKITSIKHLGVMKLYDITTTSSTFIANGAVSHNCFSNMEAFKENGTGLKYWREAELESLKHKFELAFESDKEYKEIIIELLRHKVPLHCGGMSDPFQKREWDLHLTYELIKLSDKYQYPIIFSTKTSELKEEYYEILDPNLHAFQSSIMGWSDSYIKTWEHNTSTAQERANFVKTLRNKGFWCSVRIQPIIDVEECELLMENLKDIPSYYSIEHLHILADSMSPRKHYEQNCTHKEDLYFNGGTIEFKPDVKKENVKRLMAVANKYGVKVGAADNDLHYMSQSRCCCGIDLINKNFENYLKFNTCYLSTGDSDLSKIWIPQSNCRRHMNVGKKQVVKVEDIVKKYILDNPELIPEPYSSKVNKELFGVHHKKLF